MRSFRPQVIEPIGRMLIAGKTRYKVAYGGRGGGKSIGFTDCALLRMLSEKLTITVCRELDTTIKDSIHKLIRERIALHGLDDLFTVNDYSIVCKQNGSDINFLHLHNNKDIKGLQSTKICWIFEAEQLTEESFDVLDPTVRLEGSEIWMEFNPNLEDDFVYRHFVTSMPGNCEVVNINYLDNPWCPKVLIDMAEECKRLRPNDYLHIWMGQPSKTGGRVYPDFLESVHVRDFDWDYLARFAQCFMAMDPHTTYYPFCVWIAKVPKGRREFQYVVYNEFPTFDFFNRFYYEIRDTQPCTLTMSDLAGMMKVFDTTVADKQHTIDVTRYCDTRFAKASGAQSWSTNTQGLVQEFAKPNNGSMQFRLPIESKIDVQRDRIRGLLKYVKEIPICEVNEPSIFVMPHCRNVIQSLRMHRFDLDHKREDDKYKDPCDCLRIALAGELSIGDFKCDDNKDKEKPLLLDIAPVWAGYNLKGGMVHA